MKQIKVPCKACDGVYAFAYENEFACKGPANGVEQVMEGDDEIGEPSITCDEGEFLNEHDSWEEGVLNCEGEYNGYADGESCLIDVEQAIRHAFCS